MMQFPIQNYNAQINMFKILLLTLIQIRIGLACYSSYTFDNSYKSCSFNFYNPDNNCPNFNFTSCSYKQCGEWYINSQGKRQCKRLQTVSSTDWQTCTRSCCDSTFNYSQKWDAVKQCQDYLNSQMPSSTGWIVGVSIGTSFFVLLCSCIVICSCSFCRQRKIFLQQCCCSPISICMTNLFVCECIKTDEVEPGVLPIISNQKLVLDMQNYSAEKKWQCSTQNQEKIQDKCPVCLQNLLSLELQCGHFFHRECFIECFRRKQQCIMCRSDKFDRVRVYCQNCLGSYYQTKMNTKELCQKCRK